MLTRVLNLGLHALALHAGVLCVCISLRSRYTACHSFVSGSRTCRSQIAERLHELLSDYMSC